MNTLPWSEEPPPLAKESPLGQALRRRKLKYFPEFFAIAKNLVSAKMESLEGGDSGAFDGEPDRHKILAPLEESNIVGSEVAGKRYEYSGIFAPDNERAWQGMSGERMHKPVLDIDLPIWAKESTTPGHWHLIIDKEMPESVYFELLDALQKAGILEKGFVDAAKSRGGSWIRVPWVKKGTENGTSNQGTEKGGATENA